MLLRNMESIRQLAHANKANMKTIMSVWARFVKLKTIKEKVHMISTLGNMNKKFLCLLGMEFISDLVLEEMKKEKDSE